MKISKKIKISIVTILALFALFIINVIYNSWSLSPLAWSPPTIPKLDGVLTENELLSTTERIDLDGWFGPEDIAIDNQGNLYCGVHISKTDFTDGRVLKIDTSGKVSVFANSESWVTGMHFDSNQNLIAGDLERGLISIDQNGNIKTLASEDENGNKFLIPNDVDIANDGMIYFTNTSSKVNFSNKHIWKLLMEARPDGGLYSYNPKTKRVKTLIDGTYFGNGVAVSQNDDFILMVDLAKYRIRRYWLKGDKKGTTDIFLDNLTGFPNGISRSKDGSFWLGFSTKRDKSLDEIHPKPLVKKIVYGLPSFMQPKAVPYGMLMHLSSNGEIIKTYYDTTGEFVAEATSVEEHNGYLYLGGDVSGHIGKYKLEK
ncbi:SMP-30/gluconolactonase/LRE family protein [Tenacibaculum pacificus]|uniref:SMP-30/gluconolactonase/LRE family protein n=1 Tax=Tenacibaculum pacificus TaxID=3018314 RepID=UPI0022F3CAA2|nr:SMP-30/gluconolactonase/LRE family protein [Tenacibaculum pacificus]WBX72999.1 SMP-30/gluconolactonase/LRE family protein [Tenacibaculum pacificus]